MRSSSQCEIGSREWRKAKCHEGDCQGAYTSDHAARAKAVKKAYPHIDVQDLTVDVMADRCGPDCTRQDGRIT